MKGKAIRLPAEHAAGYARDCERHINAILASIVRELASGRSSGKYVAVEKLAARLERVCEQLFDIRRELVDLRYSPEVTSSLTDETQRSLNAIDELQVLDSLTSRAALFIRLAAAQETVPRGFPDVGAALAATLEAARTIRHAGDCAIEATGAITKDAVAAEEALFDGISLEESAARERKRWE